MVTKLQNSALFMVLDLCQTLELQNKQDRSSSLSLEFPSIQAILHGAGLALSVEAGVASGQRPAPRRLCCPPVNE